MPSLRTALALTLTAAAATLAPVGAAAAATPVAPAPAGTTALESALPPDTLPTGTATGALASGVDPVRHLTLDPLSNTGVDPLDNGLGTQVADFQPLSTTAVTDPVTRGGSLATLPVVGPASGALTGS
ncbi:hypothetical protein [Actinacidiphila paucisporea]|uniref:Uncharacterized protein n=1 Tax=Actinacidiphila paucisporea TaxID=310782 RepID=A0A1M6UAT9_9ACTN|nr:hypothetical protein [Actinacidiphila paucisporea]SHK66324.1 hypothetical protein SAMN05216499_101304 [Actinacidiphila paucisporea]